MTFIVIPPAALLPPTCACLSETDGLAPGGPATMALRASLVILAFGAALLAMPSGVSLSCVQPAEWAEIQVVDSRTREMLARVPFTGHEPGYMCNIGNLHSIGGPWLAWMEPTVDDHWDNAPGTHDAGPVTVLNLDDGSQGSMEAPTDQPVHAMSVASAPDGSPAVFLLAKGGETATWIVHVLHPRMGNDQAALGGQGDEPRTFAADQAILHGAYVALLAETEAAQPHVSLHEISTGSIQYEGDLPSLSGLGPPWILLDANEDWIVVAGGERESVDGDFFLPPETRVGVYATKTGKGDRVPRATYDGEQTTHGAYRLDGEELYRAIWHPGLPWGPAEYEVMPLPPADGQRGSADGLMTGIEVDGGRLVLGAYLRSGPPENTTSWLSPGAGEDRPGPAVEIPGLAPLASPLLLAAAALSMGRLCKIHAGLRRQSQSRRGDDNSLHPTGSFGRRGSVRMFDG